MVMGFLRDGAEVKSTPKIRVVLAADKAVLSPGAESSMKTCRLEKETAKLRRLQRSSVRAGSIAGIGGWNAPPIAL